MIATFSIQDIKFINVHTTGYNFPQLGNKYRKILNEWPNITFFFFANMLTTWFHKKKLFK